MKKQFFLTVDTETTITNKVADFGAVISDRKGKVLTQCSVLTHGIYTSPGTHPLFYNTDEHDGVWSKAGLDYRYKRYRTMLDAGTRSIASVSAINRWLDNAKRTYNPVLTAYNLPFDRNKCENTGIDLTMFERNFCLWSASFTQWAHTKAFRQFVLNCHAFNAPTDLGNMTYKTNAEIMARFISGNPELEDEPHTALEDIIFYELPILNRLLKARSVKWLLNEVRPYSWQHCQVKDCFIAK